MGNNMIKGAKNALAVVLSLRHEDKVLVVTDVEKQEIGDTFRKAAEEFGAAVSMYAIRETERPLREIPEDLRSMIPGNDIIINAFSGFPEETPFRIKLIKPVRKLGQRNQGCPGNMTFLVF